MDSINETGGEVKQTRELKPPFCPACGSQLYPKRWGGMRMAFCPTCPPKDNMANMVGYDGEFDWTKGKPE